MNNIKQQIAILFEHQNLASCERKHEMTSNSKEQPLPLPPSNLESSLNTSFSSWGAAFSSAAAVKPHDLGDFNPTTATDTTSDTTSDTTTNTTRKGGMKGDDPTTGGTQNISRSKYGAGNVMGVSAIAQHIMESKQKPSSKEISSADTTCANRDTVTATNTNTAKKKSKKRKAKDALLIEDKKQMEKGDPPVKKAKKKKSSKKEKKASKKKKKSQVDMDVDADAAEDEMNIDASPTLEGQMIMHQGESIFVLIDASKHIVYAMERSESGDLVPIGKTSSAGKVEITGAFSVLL